MERLQMRYAAEPVRSEIDPYLGGSSGDTPGPCLGSFLGDILGLYLGGPSGDI